MELENISIPATNRFASLYLEQEEPVNHFFHYDIKEKTVFKKRMEDLHNRNFARQELVKCIEQYMDRFPKSNEIQQSLNKLQQDDSLVVIGGQQAGLLTGPLYTIHKIISIIILAREQEEKLKCPVIPVFWIAGEDHDYLEVNHVYAESERSIKKISYAEGPIDKRMVSDLEFDKEHMQKWVNKVFEHFGETLETKKIMKSIDEAIIHSRTIVDFFTYLVVDMFKKYGLLVIDSADKQLRELEKPFFRSMIENYEKITEQVLKQQNIINGFDFPNTIDISENALNLFYYDGHERQLLEYNKVKNGFVGKSGDCFFTRDDLLTLLEEKPEAFSNNVVTRPIMQESLFPTLAFIAGPGEIAYWGELKLAFESLNIFMPPIIPRLNITFLERSIESDIKHLNLSAEKIIRNGLEMERQQYWNSIKDQTTETIIDETSVFLEKQYQYLKDSADKSLLPIVEKNLQFHLKQLEFLQRKANLLTMQKNDNSLERLNRMERLLRPNGAPQERLWNIYYFMNKYGEEFLSQIMQLNYVFDGTHKLIRI